MRLRAKLLRRAANYEEMFNGLLGVLRAEDEKLVKALSPDTPVGQDAPTPIDTVGVRQTITNEIAWAKKTFKNNNAWITWWLRGVRIALENSYAPELFEKDLRQMQTKNPVVSAADMPSTPHLRRVYHPYFEHFMGTPCPGIHAYRPEWKTVATVKYDLSDIERQWQESRKHVISPKEEDQILINFPDGWAWWLLPRAYCSDESRAMGHCGNGGSDDETERILSLRQRKADGDWEPHLTFILGQDGYLGEMKGRNNDKPVKRYHPYIIALLENDIVNGIRGGGYKPQHNFSLADLTPAQRDELFDSKPGLMGIPDYYRKFGVDEEWVDKVLKEFHSENEWGDTGDAEWDENTNEFILTTFRNIQDLIEQHGNDKAKWAIKVFDGDEDVEHHYRQGEDAENMLDALPDATVEKIGRILASEHKEEIAEWLEEEGYDPEEDEFNVTSTSDIANFAEHVGDDVYDYLANAYADGNDRGAENEMMEYFKKALTGSVYRPKSGPEGDWWDEPWVEALSPEAVVSLVDNGQSLKDYWDDDSTERTIEMSEPYYGFQDFDEEAAIERFKEEYDVDKEFRETLGDEALKEINQRYARADQYKAERKRLSQLIREMEVNSDRETSSALWAAERSFNQGDYAPLVRMVRAKDPSAFPFAPAAEEEAVAA